MQILIRLTLGLFVIVVVILAVLMGGMRLAIVNIEYFKSEIEYLLTRDAAPGIVFTGLNGDMNRFNPVVGIENVSITLPDRSQPLFIDRLTIELDLWASLRERTPVVLEIAGKLEKLELLKDKSGKWWSNEIALSDSGGGVSPSGFNSLLTLFPRYLKLGLNRLIIRDQVNDATHQLDRVEAQIINRKDQFFMQFSAALPDQLGRGVLIKSVVGPDRSLIYVNSSDLRLSPVAGLLGLDTWGLKQGGLDGEVWINMSGFKLLAVNGNLMLKNGMVQVSPDKPPLSISYKSRFSAVNRPSSWRVVSRFESLSIDNETLPGLRSQFEIDTEPGAKAVSAWVDRLQISSLSAMAGQWLPEQVSGQIAQGKLQGLLRNLLFRVELDRPGEFIVGGTVVNLKSQRFDEYPGIVNVNAEFLGSKNRVGAGLFGSDVSLDFGDHFRAPLELDELRLEATLDLHETGLTLAVSEFELHNEDIDASGHMWIEADRGLRPFMYLRAGFSNGDGASAGKYLPRKIMPLKTQAWLDRGIKKGFVPGGEALFHGRLRDIRQLARESAGELYVDFNIENADVFFQPGWAHAKNGAGRVLFHNTGMDIDLERVSYDRVKKALVRASIADFNEPILEIGIKAELPAGLAVSTWIETPVGEKYRDLVGRLHDFNGDVKTSIDLSLPLGSSKREQEVLVLVDFDDARVAADGWGLDLTRVNGRLEVTQDSIAAGGIKAMYFGDPITIDVKTEKTGGNTLVNVGGLIESRNVFRLLPEPMTAKLTGKSDWQVRLSIAGKSAGDEQPYLRLNAASNLKNTAISLPRPFTKVEDSSTRLAAGLEFFDRRLNFTANLGNDILASGELAVAGGDEYRLEKLDLAFASQLRTDPGDGLNLYGYIPEVSVDDWIDLIKETGDNDPGLLRTLDLKIDRAQVFDRTHERLQVDLLSLGRQFVGTIDSSLIKGSFQIPQQRSAQNPMLIDLERLKINKLEKDTDFSLLRPSHVGDLRLVSKAMTYHDMEFSDLEIDARAVGNMLEVDSFNMRRDGILLTSSAQWIYDPETDTHLSSISATIKGDQFGEAIAGLGFGDSIRGGKILFRGGFTWPAPLLEIGLEKLVGDARFKIEDGVLNNVEPGSGRFVGMLSLSALPRRLSLDFSDMLIKGMEFNEIVGSYQIKNGLLITDSTRMDGPAAGIKITGKTSIINRDYDQFISVTPKIRQTLPLIGAVSAGSAVGWGLLLLQNLFKKAIDDAVEVEYHVTGSWDDPQIELIKAIDENQQELPESTKDRR